MTIRKFTPLFFIFIACLLSGRVTAQLYKVEMAEKAAGSSVIVEGKVIAQKSFWNAGHSMIFTSNTVDVYKSFKGQPAATIEVLTQGGVVGNDAVEASDLAQLTTGDEGVFFLHPNTINLRSPLTDNLLYDIFSSDQGVLRYSIVQNKAYCPFEDINGISTTLYTRLQALTGRQFTRLNNGFDIDHEITTSREQRVQSGTVTSTSPAIVKAGAILDPANNILTINGTGFGNVPSGTNAILFTDGNNNLTYPSLPVAFNSAYIVSWADAQIQVRVPGRAANGRIAVFYSTGDTAYAPQPLTISYGVLDAVFPAPYGLKEPRLTNVNGAGGYSIVYSTSTAGSGVDITTSAVYNTFKRALTTWKEISGVNFSENGTTTSQVVNAGDALNIIMLDNTNTGLPTPLAAGVLATTYSGFSLCTLPSNAPAQKKGFDVLIRNTGVSLGTTTFENGPCPPLYINPGAIDMETVILHELGHALNLSHVNEPLQIPAAPNNFANYINPSSLMHYAITTFAVRRTPDASAYSGSIYAITPQSLALGSCGLGSGEMIQLTTNVPAIDDCPLVFPTTATLRGSAYNIDLVHATSNKAVDPQFTAVSCTLPGASVTNNVYQAIRTNSAGGNVSFTVSNYATTPAELATACIASNIGTGVQMNLYAVNSCPAGQAFPAPTACFTITGNGAFIIPALQPNTNYLLFFEGVRNTKANFTVTVGGTALPLKILSFTGRNINSTSNLLSVTIAEAVSVKVVEIERSADGVKFSGIGQLSMIGSSYNGKHSFTDGNALSGANYYRVKTTDVDGKVEYSDIVKLVAAEKVAITMIPNPFSGFINIKSQAGTKLTVVVADAVMKTILQTTVNGTIQIPTAKFAAGTYFISVYDADGQLVKVEKMLKN